MSQFFARLLPETVLAFGALLVLLLGVALRKRKGVLVSVSALVLIVAGGLAVWSLPRWDETFFGLWLSPLTRLLDTIFVASGFLALMIGGDDQGSLPEAQPLILMAVLGMGLLSKAQNMVMLLLGLELLSFSLYALSGIARDRRGAEAGARYFFLGAFSTAFLVMGVALLYAATGSFGFREMARAISNLGQLWPLALGGVVLVFVGLIFKISGVPFHFWTPDVFEGAPSGVAGLIATGSKAAAFGLLLSFLHGALGRAPWLWQGVLWWVAVLTMFWGNLAALRTRSVKRMLGYSTIAHAGYLLLPVMVGTPEATSALVFYLLAYTFMTLGAFGVVYLVGDGATHLSHYAGLSRTRPGLALLLALFMVSLSGLPPLAGFPAKFGVLLAAWPEYPALVVLALINGVISAYYYFRVVVYAYMREPETRPEPAGGRAVGVALALSTAMVVYLGVVPGYVMGFINAWLR